MQRRLECRSTPRRLGPSRWQAIALATALLAVALISLGQVRPLPSWGQEPAVEAGQARGAGASPMADEPRQGAAGKLDPAVSAVLLDDPREPVSVILSLRPGAPPAESALPAAPGRAPSPAPVAARQAAYRRSAGGLLADLDVARQSGQVTALRPLWSAKALALTAEPELVRRLASRPEVRLVTLDRPYPLEPWQPLPAGAGPGGQTEEAQWNIRAIRADDVWRLLGYDGRGVTVAILDTGVDFYHPALQRQYRGYRPGSRAQNRGNWWCGVDDPLCGFGTTYPVDTTGHGTHVAGTILAGQGVGVAPGARWIAARVCPVTCQDSLIIQAMQWLLAPGGRADQRPQVMNASFGTESRQNMLLYKASVDALVASGVVVVAAAGNSPGTLLSPGLYPSVITVGALTEEGQVAPFSGYGRALDQKVKPELVAPGVGITSTVPGGGWGRAGGTSMATPHVVGVVALLLQARPDLTPAQVKDVLIRTARPLSSNPPAADSGWGLVDAFAALASVTDVGYIRGQVRRFDGAVVPWARVHLATLNGDHLVTVGVDEEGEYEIAIRPGIYVLTAEGFGLESVQRRGVPVAKDRETRIDFVLPLVDSLGLFKGRVYGRRADSRVPVSATLRLAEAPAEFTIRASEFTGFAQQLPPGTYHLRVEAFGWRVLTDVLQIAGGQTISRTYELAPAPRLLLVDGDAWQYNSAIDYYRRSLDRLGYLYDEWRVTNEDPTRAGAGAPGGPPDAGDMARYDLVIWSSSSTSPGFVGAASALGQYLAGGGRLLLSGQDALCTDAGTDVASDPCNANHRRHPYVQDQLRLRVVQDRASSLVVQGTPDGPLAGLRIPLNGPSSMDNQFAPDVLAVVDPLSAQAIATYEGGGAAAVLAGTCLDHRAIALGFGFEGISGAATRDEVMERLIEALTAAPPPHGVRVLPQATHLIAGPGATANYTLTLKSTGSQLTHFAVTVTEARWKTTIWRPGFVSPLDGPIRLGHCQQIPVGVQVQVPQSTRRGEQDVARIRIYAQEGGAAATVAITTSTAAPVLVVDGDVWINSEERYLRALEAAGVPYDVWEFGLRNSTPRRPSVDVLADYPAVIWFTGYDWRPTGSLSLASQRALASYLDQGGRLLFSSEDYLLFRGSTPFDSDRLFHYEYLGVDSYRLDEGRAHLGRMRGAPGSIFEGLAGCHLPPRTAAEDVSDQLTPRAAARAAILDSYGQPVATQFAQSPFKSVFLAFDAGLLDQQCANELIARSLDWFSPLYPSRLSDPAEQFTYASGDTARLELVLLNEGTHVLDGVRVRWQLPSGAELAAVPPGWEWDPQSGVLTWQGDLARERKTTTVELQLVPDLPPNTELVSTAWIADGQGFELERQLTLRVNAADLRRSEKTVADPDQPRSVGDRVSFFVIVRNTGTRPASRFVLTDTLPQGLQLIEGTVHSETGQLEVDPAAGRIVWRGSVDAGHQTSLSYDTRLVTYFGGRLSNAALLTDDQGQQLVLSAAVFARPQLSLPWLGNQIDPDP